MRPRNLRAVLAFSAMAIAMTLAGFPAAPQTTPLQVGLAPSDPCTFYRSRAWGRGIGHYASEMLWACEAITARRAASMPLSERLTAAEEALARFREAVVSTGSEEFARSRSEQRPYLGLSATAQREIAERTGVLAALEAIQTGY